MTGNKFYPVMETPGSVGSNPHVGSPNLGCRKILHVLEKARAAG
jgi:hypothetical protein